MSILFRGFCKPVASARQPIVSASRRPTVTGLCVGLGLAPSGEFSWVLASATTRRVPHSLTFKGAVFDVAFVLFSAAGFILWASASVGACPARREHGEPICQNYSCQRGSTGPSSSVTETSCRRSCGKKSFAPFAVLALRDICITPRTLPALRIGALIIFWMG